jgi:hypothetical protein
LGGEYLRIGLRQDLAARAFVFQHQQVVPLPRIRYY